MAFYPQFPPAAIYAYPMQFSNQDFYAMYPNGGGVEGGPVYYEGRHPGMNNNNYGKHHSKPGYNNRKESVQSTDSGISDYSSIASRKTSQMSQDSIPESSLEDSKEEENQPPMEEPDDELCESIVQQVEFYFSDANITKDKFLLKHVKRNKEGFVSLKLISSFKRVKHLTKDWRQVAVAIERKSKRLEVNDLKTKVRRLDALPEYDETTPSRTVVAMNLPLERPTIEAVAELFSSCGEIVLVRILRPGNPIPADIKPFSNKHPEMVDKVCALVEFERTEFAHRAVRELNKEEESAMKVMELTAPPPKKTKNKDNEKKLSLQMPSFNKAPVMSMAPQRRFSHAGLTIGQQPSHPGQDGAQGGARRKISLYHNMKFASIMEDKKPQQQQQQQLNPNAPSFTMQQQQQQQQQQQGYRGGRYMKHQSMSAYHPMEHHGPTMMMMQPVLVQPGPARRFSAMGGHEFSASGLTLPPNVMRLPRGPDKGKGFQHWCKNRMRQSQPIQAPRKPAQPVPQRKSRAIPIVAPPEEEKENNKPEEEEQPQGAEGGADKPAVEAAANPVNPAAPAADSGNEDEGHFSDHDLEPARENERTR